MGLAQPILPVQYVVKGSLPASVRNAYGFRWTPAHEAAFRTVVQGTRALYAQPPRFVPRPLAPILRGPNHQAFKIIAKRERHQLKRGRFSMPEVSGPRG